MAGTDEEALFFTAPHAFHFFEEDAGSLFSVRGGADGEAVLAGSEPGGGLEVEPGACGIEQEVVGDVFALAGLAFGGVFDFHGGAGVAGCALRVKGKGASLFEIDAGAVVDGGEGKGDLLFFQETDADPDVGGNPVVFGLRGNDDDFVPLAQPFPEE
ncbi:MAG: hypothetical protein QM757_00835 [Paludibaculum sp.]